MQNGIVMSENANITLHLDCCRITTYLPWDINQDDVVNLQDLVLLAITYGSTPSSSKWNPAVDIN